jgi:hypothetical protein
MNIATIAPVLDANTRAAVTRLQQEIAVLREAHACITDTTTPAVLYGRVDDLINRRQDQIIDIYQRARGGELREVHARG